MKKEVKYLNNKLLSLVLTMTLICSGCGNDLSKNSKNQSDEIGSNNISSSVTLSDIPQIMLSKEDYLKSLPLDWQQKFENFEKHLEYVCPYVDIMYERQKDSIEYLLECYTLSMEVQDLNHEVTSIMLSEYLDQIKKVYIDLWYIKDNTVNCINDNFYDGAKYYVNKIISENVPVEKLENDLYLKQIFEKFEYSYKNIEQSIISTESGNLNIYLNEAKRIHQEAISLYNSLEKQKILTMNKIG